jgi:Predicted nucleotidyltransferases
MTVESLIDSIVAQLRPIRGVEAVVLGGSRARGTHTPSSDIDLGIYYDPDCPLDIEALSRVASRIDDTHRADLVTTPGGWGPWINGGGWLTVQGTPVDLIYRDLGKVRRILDECRSGQVEIVYQPGHPFGFCTAIYLSEVALCRPLLDEKGTLQELKSLACPYPPGLKQAILDKFWWEVDFSLQIGHKSIARRDVAYAAGCCFRAVGCLTQVLFAVNEVYWMNEKGAVALADGFKLAPVHYQERVAAVFSRLEDTPADIQAALELLEELKEECSAVVEQYKK